MTDEIYNGLTLEDFWDMKNSKVIRVYPLCEECQRKFVRIKALQVHCPPCIKLIENGIIKLKPLVVEKIIPKEISPAPITHIEVRRRRKVFINLSPAF